MPKNKVDPCLMEFPTEIVLLELEIKLIRNDLAQSITYYKVEVIKQSAGFSSIPKAIQSVTLCTIYTGPFFSFFILRFSYGIEYGRFQ